MLKRIASSIASRLMRSSFMQEAISARAEMIHGGGQVAGVTVNHDTAMKYSAVYASIRCLAETRGSLPTHVFEIQGDKRVRTHSHPVAEVLSVEPHPDHTPLVWAETRMCHQLSRGNTFSEISWANDGEAYSLTNHHPKDVTVKRGPDGLLVYLVTTNGQTREVLQRNMIHVPHFGGDGIVGWSPITMARVAIGIGLSNERFAGNLFGQGIRPSLIVTHPQQLDDPTYKQLSERLNSTAGAGSHTGLILDGGLQAQAISISAGDAQFLESREYQGEEIACRFFRLPPHVVGYLRKATFSNIEAQDLYFERHTIRPLLVRDEQELQRKLFPRDRRDPRRRYEITINADAIVRADIKTRFEAHKTAILAGFKTRNEIRALENLNPDDDPRSDQLLVPESVFGKTDKSGASQTDSSTDGDDGARSRIWTPSTPDPRLRALTVSTLSGLIHRELVLVDRAAGRPTEEYRGKITDFYAKHKAHCRERLDGVVSDEQQAALDRVLDTHRDALLTAGPSHARDSCQTWPDDVDQLASMLLETA